MIHVECRAKVNDFVLKPRGVIGSGSNSGFQAINVAIHMGARKIILVGFDCTLMKGAHWHGRHPPGLNNPTQAGVDAWRGHLDRQAKLLELVGVELIVASTISTLTAYPRMTFEEALRR